MGVFADFISQNKITTQALVAASAKAEAAGGKDLELQARRAEKRAKQADVTYDKAGIEKPRSGRGVTEFHVEKALADKALPKRARGKLVRAVNALLGGKGEKATTATLFGKVGVQYGKKPKAKKKKK